jgi:hypothetical protein
LGEITDFDQADEAVKDFLGTFMPVVAAMFPTPQDVSALDTASSGR